MTEIPETICIFELKFDKTAEVALTQAETKKTVTWDLFEDYDQSKKKIGKKI